ncbi:MAG: sodium:proton antiporter [Propionibacteriales bacterium]|nr:sodium:proton antiporter [Actinophytocola sp.]MPZ61946.1 sodium:proton antiporter [Propionibacteriales bacterium]
MSASLVAELVSGVLLAAGGLFVISGGVGLLRFPDFYTRIHAVGITDSAGAGLILLGLLFHTTSWDTAVRLVLILLFMVLTGPTATHALAQAARRDGVHVWREGERRR